MRNVIYTLVLTALVVLAASCGGGVSAEERAIVDSLAGLPRVDYATPAVSFSLADIDGVKKVKKDSVPWAMYMPETDSNAAVAYYFYPGYKLELAAPQVRIEFMHRNLKGCSTPDSLFSWLKGVFLTPERKGEVVGESLLGSMDGQEIKMLEIATPGYKVSDSLAYSGKQMAWAYAEHGDYLIGFAYSATTGDDYKQGIGAFKNLVRSYKDNQE